MDVLAHFPERLVHLDKGCALVAPRPISEGEAVLEPCGREARAGPEHGARGDEPE